jgi:hypothetical protein
METSNKLRKSADVSDKRMASLPQKQYSLFGPSSGFKVCIASRQEPSDMVVYPNGTRSAQRKRGSGKICQEMDGES